MRTSINLAVVAMVKPTNKTNTSVATDNVCKFSTNEETVIETPEFVCNQKYNIFFTVIKSLSPLN